MLIQTLLVVSVKTCVGYPTNKSRDLWHEVSRNRYECMCLQPWVRRQSSTGGQSPSDCLALACNTSADADDTDVEGADVDRLLALDAAEVCPSQERCFGSV